MKNKHLLLLFLITLLIGVAAKYSPWFKTDFFQTRLVDIDPTKLQKISLLVPGKSELLLERSDEGWVASQDEYALRCADSSIAPVLAALCDIRSLRIVHSNRPDTLLLSIPQSIKLEAFLQDGRKERLVIGRERLENGKPVTYIAVGEHAGVYLTNKHLRRLFSKTIDDFRNKSLLVLGRELPVGIRIFRQNIDTLYLQKSDTAAFWQSSLTPAAVYDQLAVTQWMKMLLQVNGQPFATRFDETDDAQTIAATVELDMPGLAEPIWL